MSCHIVPALNAETINRQVLFILDAFLHGLWRAYMYVFHYIAFDMFLLW